MIRSRIRLTRLAVTLSVASVPLAAQAPADRAALVAWRDSLSDRSELAGLDSSHTVAITELEAGHPGSLAVLRLAMLEFRIAQISGDGAMYGLAADALRGVTADHPDWPMAWSEFALAALNQSRASASLNFTLQQMFGLDPIADLADPFVRGVAADSTWTEGLLRLSKWAVAEDDEVVRQVAVRVFRRVGSAALVSPELLLWRSRVEHLAGDPDSALAGIELAARAHPNHAGILRMEAKLRFLSGRDDGAEPWYRGLELAQSTTLASYLHDLMVAVPDSIRDRLAELSGAERTRTMRRFWAAQDVDGLPTGPERLAEQYRRADFVWRHYLRHSVLDSIDAPTSAVDRDTLSVAALDARGVIMLRLGTPDLRTSIGRSGGPDVEASLGIVGMPKNESWHYARRGGEDLLFHFYVPYGQADFIAAESILDLLAATRQYAMFRRDSARPPGTDSSTVVEQTYGAELVSIVAQELLRSRMDLSPIYARMLNEGKGGADSLQARERATGRAALSAPDAYSLSFPLSLGAAIDILQIGSDGRGQLVQVAYAIPVVGLSPRPLATGVVYPIRIRVAARDSAGSVRLQVDTTIGFVTRRALLPGQFLLGQLPLRLRPGTYRIRVALESDQRGSLSPSTVIAVPDPSRGSPTLSDLSIGSRQVGIIWRAPTADTAWSDPRHRFQRETLMELYFESAGMVAETPYTIELAIDRRDEESAGCLAEGRSLTLRFDQVASGGANRFQRGISLSRLEPGAYLLAITVTAPGHTPVRRCRNFQVVE